MSTLRALVAISLFLAVPPLGAAGASAASEESCVLLIMGPSEGPAGPIVRHGPGVAVGASTGSSMIAVVLNPGLHCLPASGSVLALAGYESPDDALRLLP